MASQWWPLFSRSRVVRLLFHWKIKAHLTVIIFSQLPSNSFCICQREATTNCDSWTDAANFGLEGQSATYELAPRVSPEKVPAPCSSDQRRATLCNSGLSLAAHRLLNPSLKKRTFLRIVQALDLPGSSLLSQEALQNEWLKEPVCRLD